MNHLSSSPKLNLTPLHIRHSIDGNGLKGFATLAPLQAPRFLRDMDVTTSNMGGEADGLKKMRISDRTLDLDSDSSSEELSGVKVRRHMSRASGKKENLDEVVETISPDGHVAKRRVRSRPVSLELLTTASPSPKAKIKNRLRPGHHRNNSNTSVSETGSPIRKNKFGNTKPEFDRIASSATLFFGPAIVDPSKPSHNDDNLGLKRSSSQTMPPSTPIRPPMTDADVFSPISPDNSFTNMFPKPAETSLSFNLSISGDGISPRKRIPIKFKKPRDSAVVLSDDEADEFLRPVLSSHPNNQGPHGRQFVPAQPSTSYSSSSEATLLDDSFITPSNEPTKESAWPDSSSLDFSVVDEFIVKTLEAGTKEDGTVAKRMPDTPQKRNKMVVLGAPARRPWASAIADRTDRSPFFEDKLPGLDFSNILDSGGSGREPFGPQVTQLSKSKPRKSCPGDFRFPSFDDQRNVEVKSIKSGQSSAETSPSRTRRMQPRNRTYGDVGLGRPSGRFNASQFLLRRSSSGAFSVASDISDGSNCGTPTRKKENGAISFIILSCMFLFIQKQNSASPCFP